MKKQIRIGYFADGPWSHGALDKLVSDVEMDIRFICARHDNPDPILREKSITLGIPFMTHVNINSNEFLNILRTHECDILVSMSFNQIFRPTLIKLTSMGIINCHAGKLPFYKGRNILNWALINDETDFGVTVHYVDEGIDTGDVIMQEFLKITDEDNYATLLERSYKACPELLYSALRKIIQGEVLPIKQKDIHPVGFYCSARKPGDEILNWNQSSRDIFNFVRAICCPGPSARCWLGEDEIKINRVEFLPDAPKYKGILGSILCVEKRGFLVKTADSFVRVVSWEANVRLRVGDRLRPAI